MKPLFKDYTIQKMNEDISEMIKNDKVNNLKLFVASDEAKLSVTLKADDNYNEKYHGLHPKFDDKALLNFLSSNTPKINNSDNFWSIIKTEQEKNRYMNLITYNDEIKIGDVVITERIKKELEEALLGRAILQMASHFGFRFKVDKEIIEELQLYLAQIWDEYAEEFAQTEINKDKNIMKPQYWQINIDKSYVDFLGIWPLEIIKRIENKYQIYSDNSEIPQIVKSSNGNNKRISEFLTFNASYIQHFRLRTSSVYYSGVMPRVMKIEYNDSSTSSNNVKYLIFHVVRTTFATVDFMDNPGIIHHPYFINKEMDGSRYELMIYFDNHEDMIQDKYLYSNSDSGLDYPSQRKYEINEISKINKYLEHSFNTHTIAVSANIETNDNYLLLGKRGNISIDSGEYYCSANGQTEFRDEYVSFYHTSVFEDLPSMDYNSKYRIDLTNEIQRESIAELGISSFKNEWKYYGVSYLSIHNNVIDNDTSKVTTSYVKSRRMHFNVLTSNNTHLPFKDVIESYEHATEKFENSMIRGLKTIVFKDNIDRIKKITSRTYDFVYHNKSNIFLLAFLTTYIFNKNNAMQLDASSIMDIFFLVSYVGILLYKWFGDKKIREKKTSLYLLTTKYRNKDKSYKMNSIIEDMLAKLKKGEEEGRLHAIFKVMYTLYFLDKIKSENTSES